MNGNDRIHARDLVIEIQERMQRLAPQLVGRIHWRHLDSAGEGIAQVLGGLHLIEQAIYGDEQIESGKGSKR
ncbi:MAG: hypothetical protein AAGJ54_05745 [Planctomycetota bacterium]